MKQQAMLVADNLIKSIAILNGIHIEMQCHAQSEDCGGAAVSPSLNTSFDSFHFVLDGMHLGLLAGCHAGCCSSARLVDLITAPVTY